MTDDEPLQVLATIAEWRSAEPVTSLICCADAAVAGDCESRIDFSEYLGLRAAAAILDLAAAIEEPIPMVLARVGSSLAAVGLRVPARTGAEMQEVLEHRLQ